MPKDPMIDCAALAARYNDPRLRVVDATWFMPSDPRNADALFTEAHLPGAVRFDIDEIALPGTDLPHMAPTPADFEAHMRRLEIDDGDFVVAYDAQGVFAAARAWWLFRLMGHDDVAVLDGGLPAWRAEDLPLESGPPQPRPLETRFRAGFRPELVASLDDMRRRVETGAAIVDARPAGRFLGREGEPRPGLRSGAMPGAVNTPLDALLREGRLKPAEELKALFADRGVAPEAQVTTTCGSGVTASVVALALARVGRWDAAVYDGSWAEWGQEALDTPVSVAP